jgi:hypothetical protein
MNNQINAEMLVKTEVIKIVFKNSLEPHKGSTIVPIHNNSERFTESYRVK